MKKEAADRLGTAESDHPVFVVAAQKVSDLDLIYREISKTFQYILLHYDLLKKLMIQNAEEKRLFENAE